MKRMLIVEFAADPSREAVYAKATQPVCVVYATHQAPTGLCYEWERVPCHGWHFGPLGLHWWRALGDCLAWNPARLWIAVMPPLRIIPFLLQWAKRAGSQLEIWAGPDQARFRHVVHAAQRVGVRIHLYTLKEGLTRLSATMDKRSEPAV